MGNHDYYNYRPSASKRDCDMTIRGLMRYRDNICEAHDIHVVSEEPISINGHEIFGLDTYQSYMREDCDTYRSVLPIPGRGQNFQRQLKLRFLNQLRGIKKTTKKEPSILLAHHPPYMPESIHGEISCLNRYRDYLSEL